MNAPHADVLLYTGIDRLTIGSMTLTAVETSLQHDLMLQGESATHLTLLLMVEGAGHCRLEGGAIRPFHPGSVMISCARNACRGEDFFPRHTVYDLSIIDYPITYLPVLEEAGLMLAGQGEGIFAAPLTAGLVSLHYEIRALRRGGSTLSLLRLESVLLDALWQGVRQLQHAQGAAAGHVPLLARDRQRLIKARDYIRQNLDKSFQLDDVARAAGLSPLVLKRSFRVMFGLTPWNFVIQCRLEQAKTLLAGTAMSLNEIAGQCGFAHASHLSRFFQRHYGATPGQYRRQPR